MTILNTTETMPAHWASYLINGDASGLDETEIAACDERLDDLREDYEGLQVVGIDNNSERFTWSYDLYCPKAKREGVTGGEVCDYQIWYDQPLQERLNDAIAQVADHLTSLSDVFQYDAEPEEIETKARSGFIPFTDGGAHVTVGAVLSYCVSSGAYPSPAVRAWADRVQKDCQESWEKETGHSLDQIFADLDYTHFPAKTEKARKAAELHEQYGDYEHNWLMEGCEYYYKARAILYKQGNHHSPDSTQDVVLFDIYLCLDSYGRDSVPFLKYMGGKSDQTEGEYKRVVPVSELTDSKLSEIVKEMIAQY